MSKVGQSNYDRAYFMALASWNTFGHLYESAHAFAKRMGDIGQSAGISAAAEAIAEEYRKHGLQMSSHRVLKVLSDALTCYDYKLRSLDSIEDFPIEEFGKPAARQRELVEKLYNSPPETRKKSSAWGWIIAILILIGVIWLILR
jgi:hypothetical protein